MKLNRSLKIFVGFISCFPIIYIFYFLNRFISRVKSAELNPQISSSSHFMIVSIGFMIINLLILIIFIIFIFKTEKVPKDKKVLWTLVVLYLNALVLPVFWYLYIWSDKKGDAKEI